ncbi:MAG TPA: elongation factor G [Planctomycetota bacterium]|nr:elongation factor G [Planctomycetota bacterium]
MAFVDPRHVRAVTLVGHGDAGKTTLADHLLERAGAVKRLPSVRDKTSIFDYEEIEKQVGHSVDASVGHFTYRDHLIQLVDTPGYPDFIGEAVAGYNAADLALVCVNAHTGIQVNTRRTWTLGRGKDRARAIVVTKCDLERGNLKQVFEGIRSVLGKRCVPWRGPEEVGDYKDAWIEQVVEADDELMMRYLEGAPISDEEILRVAAPALAKGKVVPVLFTSSETGEGLDTLMDFLVELGPSPLTATRTAVSDSGEREEIHGSADAPLHALVWKVMSDKHVGKIGYIRVVTGVLRPGDTVTNVRCDKKEKVTHLYRLQGKEEVEVPAAGPGDLVVVHKLESLHAGDSLATPEDRRRLGLIRGPEPMYRLSVQPGKRGEEAKPAEGLAKLADESMTFRSYRSTATHEHVIAGISQLHLETLLKRLKERIGLEVETHTPKVPYKEAVTLKSEGHFRHKKQSGGRGQFAEVFLHVEPAEPGSGLVYEWNIFGGTIPRNFEPAIEKGVRERMAMGVIAGQAIHDIKVSVNDGKYHDVDSSEAAFKIAGGRAFTDAVTKAKPVILEPIVHLEITIPGHFMGDVSGDLNTRRGRIQGMEQEGEFQTILAEMPLSEAAEYSRALSSITSGEGTFTMKPSHYEPVPNQIQQELIRAHKPHPEDD